MSAVDVALWDLKAVQAGEPLWRFLGGSDNRVRAYAGGIDLQLPLDELEQQTHENLSRGFQAIKMKVGRDRLAEDVERVWAVRAAIDQLEPTDRELVRLQHLEGLCHAEIVDRLDVAIGTVKWRSFRAHSRLSQKLGHLRDDFDEIGAGVNRGGAGDEEKGGG